MESMSFELPSRRRAGARWLLRARDGARQPLRKLPLRALRGRGLAVVLPPSGGSLYARAICFDDLCYSLDRPPGEALPPGAGAVRAGWSSFGAAAGALCERFCATAEQRRTDLIDFQPCEIVRERLAAGAIPAALPHCCSLR